MLNGILIKEFNDQQSTGGKNIEITNTAQK